MADQPDRPDNTSTSLEPVRSVTPDAAQQVSLEVVKANLAELVSAEDVSGLRERDLQYAAVERAAKMEKNRELERQAGIARLYSETAIGYIALDAADTLTTVLPNVTRTELRNYQDLAAAQERQRLDEVIEQCETLGTGKVAAQIRLRGWATVNPVALDLPAERGSVEWIEARKIAAEQGKHPSTLPADKTVKQRADRAAKMRGQKRKLSNAAFQREQRRKEGEAQARLLRSSGDNAGLDQAWSDLRRTASSVSRTVDALNARDGDAAASVNRLNDAYNHLTKAEDLVTEAMKLLNTYNDSSAA